MSTQSHEESAAAVRALARDAVRAALEDVQSPATASEAIGFELGLDESQELVRAWMDEVERYRPRE